MHWQLAADLARVRASELRFTIACRKQLFPNVKSLEEVVHKLRDELQTPQQPRVSGSCPYWRREAEGRLLRRADP